MRRCRNMSNIASVRGMHDVFPEKARLRSHITDVGKRISQCYGYEEIATPILEYTDVFKRSLGDGSDIIMKEMYSFVDKSNKSVTLRPEGTASVARAVISASILPPKKYFYYGPMFRYERPQKGRYRQFHQFGIEYIGVSDYAADIEVIDLACSFLDNLSLLSHCKLNINTLGDSESRKIYEEKLKKYYLDSESNLSADSKARLERGSILRILDSKDKNDIHINMEAPLFRESLTLTAAERFDKVLNGLSNLGIEFEVNQKLVRGLDYYSHTAFEFVSNEEVSQGTVLAGGRYDNLFEDMGSTTPCPSIGWASGLERLELLFDSNLLLPLKKEIVIVPVESEIPYEQIMNQAMLTAQTMRKLGVPVHVVLERGKLKKLMKIACSRYNPTILILLGEEEMKNGKLQVKNLDEKTTFNVSIEEAMNMLHESLT